MSLCNMTSNVYNKYVQMAAMCICLLRFCLQNSHPKVDFSVQMVKIAESPGNLFKDRIPLSQEKVVTHLRKTSMTAAQNLQATASK